MSYVHPSSRGGTRTRDPGIMRARGAAHTLGPPLSPNRTEAHEKAPSTSHVGAHRGARQNPRFDVGTASYSPSDRRFGRSSFTTPPLAGGSSPASSTPADFVARPAQQRVEASGAQHDAPRVHRARSSSGAEKGTECCVHATADERTPKGGSSPLLDTLAQLAHGSLGHSPAASSRQDAGGGDAESAATLQKRARAKFATVPLAVRLAEVAKLRRPIDPLGDSRAPGSTVPLGELEQAYRNSIYCCGELEQRDAILKGKWCGNRWCLACSRVRTARAWNRYSPHIRQWSDRHFVTLTIPNVPSAELPLSLRAMRKRLQRVGIAMNRTDGLRLKALLKVECTFNVKRCDFHPHYHLVAEGAPAAEALRRRWLAETKGASAKAQDVRPCSADEIKELFKYFTKLTTGGKPIDATALDVIFCAMRGLRTFQPIGFTAPVTKEGDDDTGDIRGTVGTRAPRPELGAALWVWQQQAADWVNDQTGDVLSGYEPSTRFRAFVDSLSPDATASRAEYGGRI